jgi:hypothetical protein
MFKSHSLPCMNPSRDGRRNSRVTKTNRELTAVTNVVRPRRGNESARIGMIASRLEPVHIVKQCSTRYERPHSICDSLLGRILGNSMWFRERAEFQWYGTRSFGAPCSWGCVYVERYELSCVNQKIIRVVTLPCFKRTLRCLNRSSMHWKGYGIDIPVSPNQSTSGHTITNENGSSKYQSCTENLRFGCARQSGQYLSLTLARFPTSKRFRSHGNRAQRFLSKNEIHDHRVLLQRTLSGTFLTAWQYLVEES